jgi:hypothetical protein
MERLWHKIANNRRDILFVMMTAPLRSLEIENEFGRRLPKIDNRLDSALREGPVREMILQ